MNQAQQTATHTPGPWEVNNGPRIYAPGKAGPLLATVAYLPRAPQQEKANARLMAAAPDLLDALEAFAGVEDFKGWHAKYSTAVEKARAAIAAARGAA